MIYVDPIFTWPADFYRSEEARRVGARHGHRWCHFFADPDVASLAMLHRVAGRIGMRRAWFQDDGDGGHYDLVPPRRGLAVQLGAKEVTQAEAVAIWERSRAALLSPPPPPAPVLLGLHFVAECPQGHRVLLLQPATAPAPCSSCNAVLAPGQFVVVFS